MVYVQASLCGGSMPRLRKPSLGHIEPKGSRRRGSRPGQRGFDCILRAYPCTGRDGSYADTQKRGLERHRIPTEVGDLGVERGRGEMYVRNKVIRSILPPNTERSHTRKQVVSG
jgi:hypothetical protein